ncbi:PREDICTED: uncharacterized protein LOC107334344 [Acropora digitifera]|uniref:uncharacterized protein LOC107334344 n=1 Tax=Acropora digitifera TaxID=70779 RepID=UPI00077ACFF5|nr:PREDICTED: uncharacterized protein LOC107334344 [Acropora digitifera]
MESRTLQREALAAGHNSRTFRSNKVSVLSQGVVHVEMERCRPDSANSVEKDGNNSVEAEQELSWQKSVHVIEQERRRKRLLFIALVALITMGLLALTAAIPFLMGTNYRDSCEVTCVEGFERKNILAGKFFCLDNGRWIGEETVCTPIDCGSPPNVS